MDRHTDTCTENLRSSGLCSLMEQCLLQEQFGNLKWLFYISEIQIEGAAHCIQLNKKIGLGHLGQEGSGGKQSRAVVIWEEEAVVASLAHTANSCTWQKRALPFSSEPQRLSPPHRSEAPGSLMWLCPRQRYTRTQNVILSLHVRLGLPPLPFRGT